MAFEKPKTVDTSQFYDAIKFVSFEVFERYTKNLIQERGLIATSDSTVNKTIEDNKWERLCDHLEPVVVPIVREFYANGITQQDYKVFVRGKRVPFDRTTNNRYYELENGEDNEYHFLIENDDTDQELIKNTLRKCPMR